MNNKLISIVLLAIGGMLLLLGASASDSVSSDVSRFFNGSPTDRTLWFYGTGVVAIVIGLFGLWRWPSRN